MIGKYFKLRERQTSIKIECVAGLTTFLTMAYIICVNPAILSAAGMDKEALIAVTCIMSGAATLTVGFLANAPIAMAPGLGLNSIFAYLVVSEKMDWPTALGVVFIAGLFFLILTGLGLRRRIVEAIPTSLISAIAVGIGLFITFIGLQDLGLVVSDENTLVTAGPVTSTVLIGLLGLLLMVYLEIRKVTGSLLVGIVIATVLAVVFRLIRLPEQYISSSLDVSPIAFKLNIIGALKWGFFGSIFTFMFIDMFDSVGTLVACCYKAEMADEQGRIRGLDKLLAIDAVATMVGAVLGTSPTTAYAESAAGIEQGGRTGLTSIVTGVLFLLALAFVPVVEIVPKYATAPALVMVGLFMAKEVKRIDLANLEEAFPSFIIIVMIALSYSISTGLAFGFVSFTLLKIILGKARDVKPTMWIIAVLSLTFLTMDQLPAMIEYIKSLM
ncbi:MAG TPA: NCS2 family permease [Sedimentisphaerales bacterium]|nr:NCS2 family permease [Sedimentisphaerales bacterium]